MNVSFQPTVVQPLARPPAPRSEVARTEPGRESGAAAEASVQAEQASAQVQAQSAQDNKVIAELKVIDREVRAHEQAHVAAGGGLVLSGPTYTYQYGPDGRGYAVGGEVSIDTSPGRTPEETIEKAQQIRAAALAPADPSGQDLAVAAAATQLELQAKQELAQQQLVENRQAEGAAPAVSAGTPQAQTSAESSEDSSAQSPEESPAQTRSRQSADIYEAIAAAVTPGSFVNVAA